MKKLSYTLEFFSPWHCGSGMGGGDDADYQPITDHRGLPFVPGKTIKGLCLEAAHILLPAEHRARIFGTATEHDNAASTQGSAFWSNAEIPRETQAHIADAGHLLQARYFVKLDEDGMAVDKSLRRGEYAIPMTLQGTVEHLEDEDVAYVADCLAFVKQLGLQRTRGFGRCQFTVTQETAEATSAPVTMPRPSTTVYFKCRFLAPVILNTSGATEGELDTLTYVPGSNFLGIAARHYADYGADAFSVFHSGNVRFGNAYPLVGGRRQALPCPANWFVPKGESLNNAAAILTTPEACQQLQATKQPKQIRSGYFVPGEKHARFPEQTLSKSFAMKSAYDSEQRKADEGKLFGFTSLNAGTEWTFAVEFEEEIRPELREKIVRSLVGSQSIGCSRSAQFGAVSIELLADNPLQLSSFVPQDGRYYLYAASPLAFTNENGLPALLPPLSDLGFQQGAYDLERTQLLYHAYCPWNAKRKSRDATRLVIMPGSVIVVTSDTPPDRERLQRGVGAFLAEGLGKVLLNPDFIHCQQLASAPVEPASSVGTQGRQLAASQQHLLDYLEAQTQQEQKQLRHFKHVREVIASKVFQSISASQWGALRAIAVDASSRKNLMTKLFEKSENPSDTSYTRIIQNGRDVHDHHPGFLVHGKKRWPDKQCEALERLLKEKPEAEACEFLQLLAAEMAKHTRTKGGQR